MKSNLKPNVIFVMGVSGSGKSTVGQLLAEALELNYIDADDFHTQSNIDKMVQGIPLTDEDRMPWLDEVNRVAIEYRNSGAVVACSALKQIYRDRLSKSLNESVSWVYLKGNFDLIFDRMQHRKSHFMKSDMLKSQFDTLEEPKEAFEININQSPESMVQNIVKLLR